MEKIYVADSYKNFKQVGEPFKNIKGKLVIKVKGTCDRCGGCGHYSYNQLDGTICYGCNGTGTTVKTVRAYTEKEYNRMQTANERARLKKANERLEKERDRQENAATYKKEVAIKLGFNENEKVYIVYGGNTFNIKDYLKEQGCHFNNVLKWYSPSKISLPEGYNLLEISFDDIYDYNVLSKSASYKNNAADIVSELIAKNAGTAPSEYYPGSEKDRISGIPAIFESVSGFAGMYGYTYVYTFKSNSYVFIWMTTKSFSDLTPGSKITLSGTIKKFTIYNGIYQTHLTRCSIEK